MTLNEWADVLSRIDSDGERRDCLLMLADELESECGATLLRELATRPVGLSPERMTSTYDWNPIGKTWDKFRPPSANVPLSLLKKMPKGTYGPLSEARQYLSYARPQSTAWLALLETLNAYEETTCETSN